MSKSFDERFREEVEATDTITKTDVLFSSEGSFVKATTTYTDDGAEVFYTVGPSSNSNDEDVWFGTLKAAKQYFLYGTMEPTFTKEMAFDEIKEIVEYAKEYVFDDYDTDEGFYMIANIVDRVSN